MRDLSKKHGEMLPRKREGLHMEEKFHRCGGEAILKADLRLDG
jgi:hypothetical protein